MRELIGKPKVRFYDSFYTGLLSGEINFSQPIGAALFYDGYEPKPSDTSLRALPSMIPNSRKRLTGVKVVAKNGEANVYADDTIWRMSRITAATYVVLFAEQTTVNDLIGWFPIVENAHPVLIEPGVMFVMEWAEEGFLSLGMEWE